MNLKKLKKELIKSEFKNYSKNSRDLAMELKKNCEIHFNQYLHDELTTVFIKTNKKILTFRAKITHIETYKE